MVNKQKDKIKTYVDVLRWVLKNQPVTGTQLTNKFPKIKDLINLEVAHAKLFRTISIPTENGSTTKYMLSFEDAFRLLEHDELQEARQSSKDAKKFATIAIIIAIVVGLFDIGFSIYNLGWW